MHFKIEFYLIIYILATTFINATQSLRNLLAKETKFCPKKHFRANQSCFMYFLIEENLNTALKYCKSFSESLVTIETKSKWQELRNQLIMFKLFQHKFKIGLISVQKNWKWINSDDENTMINFCNKTQLTANLSNTCGHLISDSTTKEWCIQIMSCNETTQFICEWKLNNFKQYNLSLSVLLRYTFLTLLIISSILLIFLLFLFYEFIIKNRQYMILYRKDIMSNLAYQKFNTKFE